MGLSCFVKIWCSCFQDHQFVTLFMKGSHQAFFLQYLQYIQNHQFELEMLCFDYIKLKDLMMTYSIE